MTASTPPSAGPPIRESDLLAYVDGRLSQNRRDQVEAYLLSHPDQAHRVSADLAIQEGLKLLFGRPLTTEKAPLRHRQWPRRAVWGAVMALAGVAVGYGAGALEAAPPLLACLR